jgi:hypothetical protein
MTCLSGGGWFNDAVRNAMPPKRERSLTPSAWSSAHAQGVLRKYHAADFSLPLPYFEMDALTFVSGGTRDDSA